MRPLQMIGPRRLALLAVAVAGSIFLSGCRVDTSVSVVERPGGSGTLGVTLSFDASALSALGGQAALARQLQYSDLVAAGWKISGPTVSAGGGETVSATHGFANGAELAGLASELAGSGGTTASSKPFQLSLSSGGGFWSTSTEVRGKVDLTCGLGCFGDPGLQAALGQANGVNPAPLQQAAGETPAQAFGFSLEVKIPGHEKAGSPGAAQSRDGTVSWTPVLGQTTQILAVSEGTNWAHVILVAVLGGLAILLVGVGLVWRLIRRRRRRAAAQDVAPSVPGEADALATASGEPATVAPGEGGSDPGGDVTAWPKV